MRGESDLIILDLMLPYLDGLSLLNELRKNLVQTPVIILTAKGMESDRLEGFRSGCDDYLVKPFSMEELIARIKAVLRRSGFQLDLKAISCGGLTLDPENRVAQFNSRKSSLTHREFDLLYSLASRPNRPLSRYAIMDEVWGDDTDGSVRSVDALIVSLRKKLDAIPGLLCRIETVYKVGYSWQIENEPDNRIVHPK